MQTATAGPVIDGVMLRGLYLFNPRQQELVVDYFKNLVGSPFFERVACLPFVRSVVGSVFMVAEKI